MARTRADFNSITTVTAATLTITALAHAGHTIVSNLAATQTFTLPAATGTGNVYRIFVAITKTGDLIIDAVGSDVINGMVMIATDASGFTDLATVTDTNITMNGTTSGGVVGTMITLTDVISGVWHCSGFVNATGAEGTIFNA